jgi:hypothetical protein
MQEIVVSDNGSFPGAPAYRQPLSAEELHEAIRKRAQEIYIRNGSIPGRDSENWAEAELEVMREVEKSQRRTAVVVDVNGVQYVGEYNPNACGGYSPGEFEQGAAVPVRFEGEKMFVRRPNGSELETTLVSKIG